MKICVYRVVSEDADLEFEEVRLELPEPLRPNSYLYLSGGPGIVVKYELVTTEDE